MKFCNIMHTKTQMTQHPVQGPRLKETPFFGLFSAHPGPLYTALMTFSLFPASTYISSFFLLIWAVYHAIVISP